MGNKIGRPLRKPVPGKREQIGAFINAELKALMMCRADAVGRSFSQEIEAMLERCLAYDRAIDAFVAFTKKFK